MKHTELTVPSRATHLSYTGKRNGKDVEAARANELHHRFKCECVMHMPKGGWVMGADCVQWWLDHLGDSFVTERSAFFPIKWGTPL